MHAIKNDHSAPVFIRGVSDIADKYDAFILDIWGVIHNGIKPFAGTINCLTHLKNSGKQVLLLSNTPDRSNTVTDQLAAMDIERSLYDHILTAGESAWLGLKHREDAFHQKCGHKCFCPGDDFRADDEGTPLFFQDIELDFVDDAADATFFLNACGGARERLDCQWEQTKEALAHNLPMICTNPDLVVNVGDEQYVCAGTFAKYYEENGGEVLYHGKPHLPIYEMAWTLLGKPDKARMIAIGDSLHTDIRGANRFGIDSIFNFSGIHGEELGTPDKLEAFMAGKKQKPSYAMKEFLY